MKVRPIDANALYDALRDNEFQTFCPLDEVDGVIAAAPTLYYVPRQQWISVKDRLPRDIGKSVLVVNGHGKISIYALWKRECGNKWTWIDSAGRFNHVNDITHWMPLPKAPKEE